MAPRLAQWYDGASWKISYNERADPSSHSHGQPLPRSYHNPVFVVFGTQFREWASIAKPVVPIERNWPRSPLFLEAIGPFTGRRSTKIKDLKSALAGKLQHRPVQQHIRTESIVGSQGRRPGNLKHI